MLRALCLLLVIVAGAFAPVKASEFTPAQKDELGPIIRDYLMQNPEVLRDALQELERRQSAAEDNARKQALTGQASAVFHDADDLVGGNPQGKVTLVEFFDYNCGYCRKAFPDVIKMIESDKDLRLVMKEFPILGPGSVYAARAALASRKQGKYWEYHVALMNHEGRIDEAAARDVAAAVGLDIARLEEDMKSKEIDAVIQRTMSLAEALNIQGTPAFIIDETIIPGAIGFEGLAAAVRQVRDNGGCRLC